jgi:hypothetical protein
LAVPVQAPDGQPAQAAQWVPDPHCASLVHQHGTPAAAQPPLGDVAVLHVPAAQDQALAMDVAVRQSSLSAGASPVHETEHWELLLTHLPLEQFESATQRHALWSALSTGVGVRLVVHAEPPVPAHATELGGG